MNDLRSSNSHPQCLDNECETRTEDSSDKHLLKHHYYLDCTIHLPLGGSKIYYMAGLLESLSVRWTVTIPTRPPWPNSYPFYLRDVVFHLNCSENRRGKIFLNLMCPDDTPFESCLFTLYCTVSVENSSTGRVVSPQSVRLDDTTPDWTNRLESYTINIWQQHVNDIEEEGLDFCHTRELTFTITWGTLPLHISKSRIL